MDGENTPQVVHVGGGGNSRPSLSRLPKLKGTAWLIVVGVIILGAAIVYAANKPALKVGKYAYDKEQYASLIAQAKSVNINEKDARKALVKSLASREAADRLKVSYATDDTSLNTAARYEYKVASKDEAKINEFQRTAAMYRITDANVRLESKGGYKATVVSLPFSRYIYGFTKDSDAAKKANVLFIHNAGAVLKDVGDARKRGDTLRSDLASNKISLEEAVRTVRSDSVLNYNGDINQSGTVLLTSDKAVETYIGKDSVQYLPRDQNQMIEANKGNLNKPSELAEDLVPLDKTLATPQIVRGNTMAVGYYFVVVQQVVSKKADIQNQYDKLVSELNHV